MVCKCRKCYVYILGLCGAVSVTHVDVATSNHKLTHFECTVLMVLFFNVISSFSSAFDLFV